ncbi:MAG: dTDP-4-dehydrorhamnose 3,5-epimerase family protein, partial [Actinobacteria bacterium]|nr:dTDP-4-dehydrorhamnose 3,5-epimerase family protein [Actinomycetota bacterium]
MEILNTSIDGVFFIHPDVHADDRGRFVESYRREWIVGGSEMLQSNRSEKIAGSLVCLHYHLYQADYW